MNRILRKTVSIVGLTSAAGLVQADTLGFSVGGYFWQQNYEGTAISSDLPIDQIDIEDDLGLEDDSGHTVYVAFEHPIPLLPNVMVQRTELNIEATAQPSRDFSFDGVTYTATDTIATNSDLSHTDATLYYELLDNWVSLDFGLTIRHFDQGIRLESATAGDSELELDVTIPMAYLAAKGELPLSGFFAKAEANGISYGDGRLLDYRVSLGYETDFGIGIEFGMRNFDVDYEDGNEEANFTIDGGYAGVYYHF